MVEYVYLLVKIRRGTQVGEHHLSRPENWNPQQVHFACVGEPKRCGGVGRGEAVEHELWKIRRDVAEDYARKHPESYAILGEEDATGIYRWCAKLYGDEVDAKGVPSGLRVTSESMLAAIDVKVRAGIPLKKEEKEALDPDKPGKGLGRPATTAQEHFGGPPAMARPRVRSLPSEE